MGRRKEKSRFPAARIKKIMRSDDEVGKVAQATPVLVSKALELFIQALVEDACKETIARGAKKLTSSHLKVAINTNPKFDFLKDLVANVPDLQDADSLEEAGASGGKGKGRGGVAVARRNSKKQEPL
ncbi:histone-fold-containing protein [Zopfochytrium polystomum]|nr:histone-fold-containing protein [Zopfochytrium polystomum]